MLNLLSRAIEGHVSSVATTMTIAHSIAIPQVALLLSKGITLTVTDMGLLTYDEANWTLSDTCCNWTYFGDELNVNYLGDLSEPELCERTHTHIYGTPINTNIERVGTIPVEVIFRVLFPP